MSTVNSKGYVIWQKKWWWIGRPELRLVLRLPKKYHGKRIAFKVVELK